MQYIVSSESTTPPPQVLLSKERVERESRCTTPQMYPHIAEKQQRKEIEERMTKKKKFPLLTGRFPVMMLESKYLGEKDHLRVDPCDVCPYFYAAETKMHEYESKCDCCRIKMCLECVKA